MTWSYIIHLGIISIAFLLAALIRSKISILRKYMIPASIIGGVILFFFYNFCAPYFNLDTIFLEELIYHLLNVSFIAMMLRPEVSSDEVKDKKFIGKVYTGMLAQYGLQSCFGLSFVFVVMYTFNPDIFLGLGLNLVLGFELGPGQAYSVTKLWEPMGFPGGGSFALALGAMGFLVGSICGVILINLGIKKGWIDKKRIEKLQSNEKSDIKEDSELYSLDSLTYHFALVFGTYLISYLLLTLITAVICLLGPLGVEFANSLWGINFIFSAVIAILVKKFLQKTKLYVKTSERVFSRITGLSVDLTVITSLGAISIMALSTYWLELIVLTILGIFITCFVLPWYCSRLFVGNYAFEYMIIIFGGTTGTLPTGLSLLRIIDPNFETPAATNYMYASGFIFLSAIPLILAINLPAHAFVQQNMMLFYLAFAMCLFYLLIAVVMYVVFAKKNAFKNPKKFFYTED